ncbi:MAG: RNA polymerase sigma factor, partial [Eudoraea sp.]|nr:RNA polymerase sigma factor [Eudoraea sp.]
MVSLLKKLILVIVGKASGALLAKDDRYQQLSDEELVKTIVDTNNSLVFGVLYDRYAKRIYNKCYGFARSADEAEDLTQDVFLMIYVKLASFQGRSKFSSWVYALTYNFCVNYVNRNKERKIKDKTEQIDLNELNLSISVEDKSLFRMRSDKLKKVLEQAPPEDRTLLLLKYQDDVPVKELARIMDIGESAVKMRL